MQSKRPRDENLCSEYSVINYRALYLVKKYRIVSSLRMCMVIYDILLQFRKLFDASFLKFGLFWREDVSIKKRTFEFQR